MSKEMDQLKRQIQMEKELRQLVNRTGYDNFLNTPDYIVALYLIKCLQSLETTIRLRDQWQGKNRPDENQENQAVKQGAQACEDYHSMRHERDIWLMACKIACEPNTVHYVNGSDHNYFYDLATKRLSLLKD